MKLWLAFLAAVVTGFLLVILLLLLVPLRLPTAPEVAPLMPSVDSLDLMTVPLVEPKGER